jgi:HAD superfamily hydrolase (TIGR01450 family)
MTPLDGVDVLLADLDGVVYTGPSALPYAVESINRAQASIRVGYITNNASRTPESVAQHLNELGLRVVADDVVTSPQAAIVLLEQLVAPGSTILVVGGEGLTRIVEEHGFHVTRSAEDGPAAVIQGFHPSVAWSDLAEAAFALRPTGDSEGIPWVATNTDWTIPQPRGTAPGNGTLVSAVHTAVGRLPVVAGKPERPIFEAAIQRFAASHALFLGDRLDTDIIGANRAGIASALVLTGIDGPKQVLAADAESRPTFLLGDLRELFEPYSEPVARDEGDDVIYTAGSAAVRLSGAAVTIVNDGDSEIDLLRAGAAAVWNAGRPIYALGVDPGLYS